MKQAETSNKRGATLRIITLVVIGAFLIPLALMNLTPGHLGFPDDDGCACFVAYTTFHSLPACEQRRPIHCDRLWIQQLVADVSSVDFSK